jgi:hypothetical protein
VSTRRASHVLRMSLAATWSAPSPSRERPMFTRRTGGANTGVCMHIISTARCQHVAVLPAEPSPLPLHRHDSVRAEADGCGSLVGIMVEIKG